MPQLINLNNARISDSSVVSFGNFDGLHLGHGKLIDSIMHNAKRCHAKSILVIFNPHTKKIISEDFSFKEISPYKNKLKLLKTTNLDYLITVEFDNNFSNISPDNFIKLLIKKLNPCMFILGYDNRFGKNGKGSYLYLKKYIEKNNLDIKVNEFSQFNFDSKNIKSSIIKNLIEKGNVKKANKLLGRNFAINGKIIEGNKMGGSLGFPTANLKIDSHEQILPMHGVYCVNLILNKNSYRGLCNIGWRPTFNHDSDKITIETHLINQNINLYNENVEIEFLSFLRHEKKFDSQVELVSQIKEDIKLM